MRKCEEARTADKGATFLKFGVVFRLRDHGAYSYSGFIWTSKSGKNERRGCERSEHGYPMAIP
jgi:hypothetical protein